MGWWWALAAMAVWAVSGPAAEAKKEDSLHYKYQIHWYDPFGPLLAALAFFGVVGVVSGTCLLWCCVDEAAEPSVFPDAWPRIGRNKEAVRQRRLAKTDLPPSE